MLFENTHRPTAKTAERSEHNSHHQGPVRPVKNTLPKFVSPAVRPVTKSNASVTGWPSAVKQPSGQTGGPPVQNILPGAGNRYAANVNRSNTSALRKPPVKKLPSGQTVVRPLQNTSFVSGKKIVPPKTVGYAANTGALKQTTPPPIINRSIIRQTSYINPVKKTGSYRLNPGTNQQGAGWGSNRLTTAPTQITTANRNVNGYRYNTNNPGTIPASVINRRNYQGWNTANTRVNYRSNNRPGLYNNLPVQVPAQTVYPPVSISYQAYGQPNINPKPPCSCTACKGHNAAIKQPPYLPDNRDNYGGNYTEQIITPPLKQTAICRSCGKTGKGCATIARFTFNSFQLKKRHIVQLKELARNILNKKINVVIATGHTDSSGKEDYNQELGAKRAGTVISELRKQLSLLKPNAQRSLLWRTDSKGETQPVVTNNAPNNRRVEICLRRTKL